MKRSLLFLFALVLCMGSMAQTKPIISKAQKDFKVERPTYHDDGTVVGLANPNVIVSNKAMMEDPTLMQSKYDQQSNCNTPRHIYVYPDGTIGVGSMIANSEASWSDRGTGYAFYNGTTWSTAPTARIETKKTGWANYQPLGPNGEVVLEHISGTAPLFMTKRDTKNSGSWTESNLPGITTTGMLWPRMITNGTDHNNIHVIALTAPTANGGALYNGMDGALLYNRSLDGGTTWEGWQQLPGMTSSEYLSLPADGYEWANPQGDTIAFVYGDAMRDLAIMKSTDNGANWTQTRIWPCPYNLWTGADSTGIFYCSDGYVSAAMDKTGKVHVLTGLQRSKGDIGGATYWYPYTDSLLYWNEDMPTWPEELNTADLYANGNIIGWCPDTMVWYSETTQLGYYYNSMSSFPTMTIDNEGNIYAMWSSVTTLLDPDNMMLRHLFRRAYDATAQAWSPEITDLTSDLLYTWSECVYPVSSPTTTSDKVHIVFQADDYAGVYLKSTNSGYQGQSSVTTNDLKYITTPTFVGVNEIKAQPNFAVEQNMPNPVNGTTTVKVVLAKPATLSLAVTTLTGQKVMEVNNGQTKAGNTYLTLDCSNLPAGIYFYTVTVGNETNTHKMIVK